MKKQVRQLLKRLAANPSYETVVNIVAEFPAFEPNSRGSYASRSRITINTINRTLPALQSLMSSLNIAMTPVADMSSIMTDDQDKEAAEALRKLFDHYGSDKANPNNYHLLYGHILKNSALVTGIFEVGLGTNNETVVSNMTKSARPGASLFAFRDFCKAASIYGADIDKNILFEHERIKTFFVDQTDRSSFDRLEEFVPDDLDLVIDDGLHSPDANIETVRFGLSRIKVGGWMVVEDIGAAKIPLWRCISGLLPSSYKSYILKSPEAFVFAAKRLT